MPNNLASTDIDIFNAIQEEKLRQDNKLELIASENIASQAVMEATGSILTNKYAEGYPGKRYYGGCEHVDVIEDLAISRAQKLFNAEYANVQPHSGSSANMGVYMSILQPGDKIAGMDLAHGGHLTHGASVSFSGKQYDVAFYGVDKKTELIDFNQVEEVVSRHKPKILVAGASSYSRILDFKTFAEIAQKHGAILVVDMAHIAGLVAAGLHPSPLLHADIVTSTTHKTLRGPRGGLILVGKNKENPLGITTSNGKVRKYSAMINSTVFPGIQGGPLMHVIAAKAVCFKEAMQDDFKKYQEQVLRNAKVLASTLESLGARIVSGGTDNHIVLVDVLPFGVTGKDAEIWLDMANISSNKNAIPFDPNPPTISSGIRLGTPALTTRGMKETEMKFVAEQIVKILKSNGDDEILTNIAQEIKNFVKSFI